MNVIQVRASVIKTVIALLIMTVSTAMLAGAATTEDQIAAIKAQKNDAIFKVQHIVNQPVKHLKRTPDMHVWVYPVWYHDGASEPGYDRVDVRQTQDLKYQNYQYVASSSNPGEVYLGPDLEFNPLTQYFYTDNSVPKKRLTEDEMLQINALYRVIGHCDEELDDLQHPEPIYDKVHDVVIAHKPVTYGAVAVLFVGLILFRKRQARA